MDVNWDECYSLSGVNKCYDKFNIFPGKVVNNCTHNVSMRGTIIDKAKIKSPRMTKFIFNKWRKERNYHLFNTRP